MADVEADRLMVLGLFSLGPHELIGILLVALLIFGRRLPQVARSVGKSLAELRQSIYESVEQPPDEDPDEDPQSTQDPPPPAG